MYLALILLKALEQVWLTLQHNWPFIVFSALVAAAMKLYLNTDVVEGFLRRHEKGGVLLATAAAVGTPLCSCGTTAIVLGMMAGSMPWAPIIAFMVASPLTSPEELIYSAGLFGWPFAIAFFVASIILGLAGGLVTEILDVRGWLRNQGRFAPPDRNLVLDRADRALSSTCGCDMVLPLRAVGPEPCACGSHPVAVIRPERGRADCGCSVGAIPQIALMSSRVRPAFRQSERNRARTADEATITEKAIAARTHFQWAAFLAELFVTGRRLLVMFLGFALIGHLINDLIPTAWITGLFGSGHAYSVPLAATLGLPFYLNTEASLPLVRGMLDSGMSAGAALAFLITGAGTSIGAVAGAMTIARWRVIALVIATLWAGAILCGFAYDALVAARLLYS